MPLVPTSFTSLSSPVITAVERLQETSLGLPPVSRGFETEANGLVDELFFRHNNPLGYDHTRLLHWSPIRYLLLKTRQHMADTGWAWNKSHYAARAKAIWDEMQAHRGQTWGMNAYEALKSMETTLRASLKKWGYPVTDAQFNQLEMPLTLVYAGQEDWERASHTLAECRLRDNAEAAYSIDHAVVMLPETNLQGNRMPRYHTRTNLKHEFGHHVDELPKRIFTGRKPYSQDSGLRSHLVEDLDDLLRHEPLIETPEGYAVDHHRSGNHQRAHILASILLPRELKTDPTGDFSSTRELVADTFSAQLGDSGYGIAAEEYNDLFPRVALYRKHHIEPELRKLADAAPT